jgi:hypothetical protein
MTYSAESSNAFLTDVCLDAINSFYYDVEAEVKLLVIY